MSDVFLHDRSKTETMRRRVAVENLGCKVNRYEADAVAQRFANAGYELVDYNEKADVYILNTCGVTAEAGRKSRQQLHKAKRMNPDAVVVAMGCQAELTPDELPADLCIGNQGKESLLEIVERYIESGKQPDQIAIAGVDSFEDFGSVTRQSETRAYLKVQDGCNNFCSYCAIPLARGRVRSRNEESILREASELSAAGFKELVITGIHVCSYGADRGESSLALVALLERIAEIDGIERIRLSSLEPKSISEAFVSRAAKITTLCPHFHLSLQSGCDKTLKAMNRRYTSDDYRRAVALIRNSFPFSGITTDVIVGFPGESEQDFEESLNFCEEMDFSRLHVFRYSARQGTKAAERSDQVDGRLSKLRSERLIALGNELQRKAFRRARGREAKILLEMKLADKAAYVGYTTDYLPTEVLFSSQQVDSYRPGQIVNVRLTDDLGERIGAEIR